MTQLSLADSCSNKQHTLTNYSEGLFSAHVDVLGHLLGPVPPSN